MPKVTINTTFGARAENEVKADFLNLYGGSEQNWNWLRATLRAIKPFDLKKRCQPLKDGHVLKLDPCWVFGRLYIQDEAAWTLGLEPGVLTIDAVVHSDHASTYYQARLKTVPASEQDV